jgi:hypothetical protein
MSIMSSRYQPQADKKSHENNPVISKEVRLRDPPKTTPVISKEEQLRDPLSIRPLLGGFLFTSYGRFP